MYNSNRMYYEGGGLSILHVKHVKFSGINLILWKVIFFMIFSY